MPPPAGHAATRRRAAPGLARAAVASLAVVAAVLVTWRASGALYTGTTTNGTDSFATGSVTLTDDDAGTALLSVSGLRPGGTTQQCIAVAYGGTLAAAVKVYGAGLTATNGLDAYLNVQIEEGAGGGVTFPSCTGFAAASTAYNGTLSALGSAFASASGTWAPTGAATRDYRITCTLSGAAPSSVVSSSASVTLTWEAQST